MGACPAVHDVVVASVERRAIAGMRRFHVFLKAPTTKDLKETTISQDLGCHYQWHTSSYPDSHHGVEDLSRNTSSRLPSATLEVASRRISMLYENIIFRDNHENGEDEYIGELDSVQGGQNLPNTQG